MAAGFAEPAVTAAYTHLYKKIPWRRIVPKVLFPTKFFAKMDEQRRFAINDVLYLTLIRNFSKNEYLTKFLDKMDEKGVVQTTLE